VLGNMEESRMAQLDKETLQRRACLLEAEAANRTKMEEAAETAEEIMAFLEEDDMEEDSKRIGELKDALNGGNMKIKELEDASNYVHELAHRLRGMEKDDLAGDVEEFGVLLDNALKAALDVAVKTETLEYELEIRQVLKQGRALSKELCGAGLFKNAANMDRVMKQVQSIASGKAAESHATLVLTALVYGRLMES
jgi:hypothetical protein